MSSDPNSITGWGEFLELESENKDEWESNKWVDYTELIGKLDVEALEDCERWMKEIIKTCEHIKGCISAYGYYMKTNQPDKAANVLKENGLSYQKRLCKLTSTSFHFHSFGAMKGRNGGKVNTI